MEEVIIFFSVLLYLCGFNTYHVEGPEDLFIKWFKRIYNYHQLTYVPGNLLLLVLLKCFLVQGLIGFLGIIKQAVAKLLLF